MRLSFECPLDPESLSGKQGKKFCDSCQKQVHDLRRKNDEKIAGFYAANPTACVIIYEDQLERLPVKAKPMVSRPYFPYAASLVVAALLPTPNLAQTSVQVKQELVSASPVPLAIPSALSPLSPQQKKEVPAEKYFYTGKVKVTSKKNGTLKGREIQVIRRHYSPEGNYTGVDTLAKGTLGPSGKFKLSISEENFRFIKDNPDDVIVHVENLRRARTERISVHGNKVRALIKTTARRIYMGKF